MITTDLMPISLDSSAIRKLLPHRDCMALLDAIDQYIPEARHLVAIKRVPMNEFSIQSLSSRMLYFPPTLLVEALAQASGIMMNMEGLERLGVHLRQLPDPAYRATIPEVPLSVLAESHIEHQSFASPGDTIYLQSKVAMQRAEFRYFQVSARTSDRELAKGTILLSYPSYM